MNLVKLISLHHYIGCINVGVCNFQILNQKSSQSIYTVPSNSHMIILLAIPASLIMPLNNPYINRGEQRLFFNLIAPS